MQVFHDFFQLFFDTYKIENIDEKSLSFACEAVSNKIRIPSEEDVAESYNCLSNYGDLLLDFSVDGSDPFILEFENINLFLDDVRMQLEEAYEDSSFILKIDLTKSVASKHIPIFNTEVYFEYLKGLTINGILYEYERILAGNDYLIFEMHDDFLSSFRTETMSFISKDKRIYHHVKSDRNIINQRSEVTTISNLSEDFLPEDFRLIEKSNNNEVNLLFNKLAFIYCLISILDVSKMFGDNKLELILNGYRSIKKTINFNELIIHNQELDELYKVYQWVYNEGNLIDKIGLTRNLMSLHISRNETNETNPFQLKENLFLSLKSNYDIYLKKNVEQYIRVKSQVSEHLINLSVRSDELVRSFGSAIKNNNLVFLSFFLTVIVFNALSFKKSENIFRGDIAYVGLGILTISFIYLVVNILFITMEVKRYKEQYDKIKKLYNDILEPNELEAIFKKDNLMEDIKYVESKTEVFAVFWFLEIIVLSIIIAL